MTSYDIFLLAASFSLLLLTGFLCWVLYYFGSLLKDVKEIVRRLKLLMEGLESIREKMSVGIASLSSIAKVLVRLIESWRDRRNDDSTTPSPRRNSKKL